MISVSPVFVFDMARLGPRRINDSGGLRYGVGGGVRFTLASHVNVTVGYAANPDRRPWESRGAWFASLDFLDLIR